MTMMLAIFSIVVFVIAYYNTNKYLTFVNEFTSIEDINFQKLNDDMCEILFCTKEQLKNNCKLILKFYSDNKSNYNTKSLKILGDEESFNIEKSLEFFKTYKIDYIPSISFLEYGRKTDYITLEHEG